MRTITAAANGHSLDH